ncbi:hypothetical protein BDV96DRAFT_573161 [Lophiotrema nucula]|uniref:C2H2-type domain-containing protein n=1 Tax=Lophiotrema nucula TaxID=690887 RepID=A0A6A5ZBS1_9PLEO|nr:hypothetical protein BDV96DRAFT_573161 [Lophiotrema nucula]
MVEQEDDRSHPFAIYEFEDTVFNNFDFDYSLLPNCGFDATLIAASFAVSDYVACDEDPPFGDWSTWDSVSPYGSCVSAGSGSYESGTYSSNGFELQTPELEQDAHVQRTATTAPSAYLNTSTPVSLLAHSPNISTASPASEPRYLPLQRVHELHACLEANCSAKRSTIKQLREHIQKKHTRVFCDVTGCEKATAGYTDRSSLSKHRRAKHEGYRVKCEHINCGREFDREYTLRRHAQTCKNNKRKVEGLKSNTKRRKQH